MSGDTFDFNQGARETLRGTLHDPAATPGDVLVVQADGAVAAQPGGGGSSAVLSARLKLTDAQIKALPTTPLTMVAGVAGKIIWPIQTLYICDTTIGNVYTNISADAQFGVAYPVIGWDTLPGNSIRNDPGGLLLVSDLLASFYIAFGSQAPAQMGYDVDAIIPSSSTGGFGTSQSDSDLSPYEGQDLQLQLGNVDGDLTGGDPANYLIATCLYTLFDPS